MRTFFLFGLIGFLFVACASATQVPTPKAPKPPIPKEQCPAVQSHNVYMVSKEIQGADKDALIHAADEWVEATGGCSTIGLQFDVDLPARPILLKGENTISLWYTDRDKEDMDSVDLTGGLLGLCSSDYAEGIHLFFVRDRLDSSSLTPVMIHEMGHALGLGHNPQGCQVMSAGYCGGGWKHLTPSDMQFCRASGVCPDSP